MDSMKTPRTRAEFERNFYLLYQQIVDGKFHVAQGLSRSLDGLTRVRHLPNGRIDFLSVDESARLQANMLNHMSKQPFLEHLKKDNDPPVEQEDESNHDPGGPGSDFES